MKLLLVDGNPLLYRAAVSYNSVHNGVNIGILVGYTTLLASLIRKTTPTHVAVVFDERGRPNWRKRLYPGYKQSRGTTVGQIDVTDLNRQAVLVRELLGYLGVPLYHAPGIEADDLIGIMATYAARDPFVKSIVIASQDKDFFQILDGPIKLYDGIRDRTFDNESAAKNAGVAVKDWKLHASLSGAGGDDIPTPPGVGPKYAAQIASTYPTLDLLFAAKGVLLTGPKWKQSIAKSEDIVRQAYRLVTIVTADNLAEFDSVDLEHLRRVVLARHQPDRVALDKFLSDNVGLADREWILTPVQNIRALDPYDFSGLTSAVDESLSSRSSQ